MRSPTPTQLNVLRRMVETGRTLRRWNGGFWTTDADPVDGDGLRRERMGGQEYAIPSWSCTVATVRAMTIAGWVERCNTDTREWCDERRLTDAGRELVR